MKEFLLKTTFLSLPIILCFICLETVLRQIPDDYKYKADYLDKNALQIETLILGSSHSFFGIDPIYFENKTFNASHVSQSLDYDKEIVMNFNWENLKTIYVPISYFTMWGRLKNGGESWRCNLYYRSYGIDKDIITRDKFKIFDKFSTNIRKVGAFILKDKNSITCSQLGWGTTYNSKESRNLLETGKSASKRHTRSDINSEKYSSICKENINYLNEIVTLAKSKKVRVVLFTPPAYKTYRENLNTDQLAFMNDIASDIANKYENCVYVNMMADLDFIDLDYYDADHLSEIGAKKLSKKLNGI
jgi:hypothetical protein